MLKATKAVGNEPVCAARASAPAPNEGANRALAGFSMEATGGLDDAVIMTNGARCAVGHSLTITETRLAFLIFPSITICPSIHKIDSGAIFSL